MSFIDPKSIEEAYQRRDALLAEVQRIQLALGNRNQVDAQGKRIPTKTYWDWRNKAGRELNERLEDIRKIKNWIKLENGRQSAARVGVPNLEDPKSLIEVSLGLFNRLIEEGVALDPQEMAVIEALKAFMRRPAVQPR